MRCQLRRDESGVALIVTLMVMMLISALLVGFTTMVSSNMQMSGLAGTGTDGFYTALAGSEKLTSDLGGLFATDISPSGDAVRALADDPPSMDGVSWLEPDGSDGYRIEFDTTTGNPLTGDPVSTFRTVTTGPYAGFIGLVTEYDVITTAGLLNGAERSLSRTLQTVGIPVFQFGTFSETDLSFFPQPTFNFGGRVHTNGHLFLASIAGLRLTDKVTAVGEVVRKYLSNGQSSTGTWRSYVDIQTSPGSYRDLDDDEGSVVGNEDSGPNEPTWTNLSTGTYNGNIRNGSTGVTRLDLPIVTQGAEPVDLVRRPLGAEDPNGFIFPQRYFSIASLRILLSDTAAEITSLPSVTGAAPIELDDHVDDAGGDPLNPWPGYVVGANNPPLARSSNNVAQGYRFPLDDTSHGGFIKIEFQNAAGTWIDVTAEILGLGIASANLAPGCGGDPNPNAVVRLQRLRDDGNLVQPGATLCGEGSTSGYDYWPNVLYDTREGPYRDNEPTGEPDMYLSGVMHYVMLDVNNLRRWLDGTIGVNGPNVLDQNGFVIYFSDRRLNKDAIGDETGELGFEDFVNPASGSATPNGILDAGEDLNDNGTLETYGNVPQNVGAAPLDGTATLRTMVSSAIVKANRPIFFRRGLKLVNGGLNQIPMPGLSVASENPVYIQGDWNASGALGGFVEPNAATAVLADSVTLLSNAWTDLISFTFPHRESSRDAVTTWWRVAVVAGKGLSFARPSGTTIAFGTTGGVPNFLRFLEDWGGRTVNYSGAMVSFYTNRQAVSPFRCCVNVYTPPTRAFLYDVDFLDPTQLPPATPMFRDVNVMGFTHRIVPDR